MFSYPKKKKNKYSVFQNKVTFSHIKIPNKKKYLKRNIIKKNNNYQPLSSPTSKKKIPTLSEELKLVKEKLKTNILK